LSEEPEAGIAVTRSDDDGWDIRTGAGSTAVIVAALRAEEANSPSGHSAARYG
jgi:hypothetical protein